MSNETEKVTINLSVVELAEIDVLVEQGIYSNRSDLIRTAIRKQLEVHEEKIERFITPFAGIKSSTNVGGIGIFLLGKRDLTEAFENNGERPIKISVVGILKIGNDVSAELFNKTVERVSIRGKLVASPEIKELLANANA